MQGNGCSTLAGVLLPLGVRRLFMLLLASCLVDVRAGKRHPEEEPCMVCRFRVPQCVEGRSTLFETLLGPEGFAAGVAYAINLTVMKNHDEILWEDEILHRPVAPGKLHAVVRTTIPPLRIRDDNPTVFILRLSVVDKYPGLSNDHTLICQYQVTLPVERVSARRALDLKNWRAQRVRLDMYENSVIKALANVPGWLSDSVEKMRIKDMTTSPDMGIRANDGTRVTVKTYKVTAGEEGESVAFC